MNYLLAHLYHGRRVCEDCGLDREVATAATVPVEPAAFALFAAAFVTALCVLFLMHITDGK